MDDIKIAATERTPEIDFDFGAGVFSIKNESYPEDVTEFYGPVIEKFKAWLEDKRGAAITFNFELIYFNSSTAKVIMDLFDILEESASDNDVTVHHEDSCSLAASPNCQTPGRSSEYSTCAQ